MAAFLRLLLILWVALRYGQSQSPSSGMMTVNPSEIRLTLDTIAMGIKMSMTCRPPSGTVVANLQSMSIMKKVAGSDPWNGDVLVQAALKSGSANDAAELVKTSLRNVTVSGSIEQKTISLTLNQANCNNGGTYVCVAMYFDSSNTFHWQYQELEVKVEVDAHQLNMTVSPERPWRTEVWKVDDKLSMKCSGPVGSVNTTGKNPQPQITWVWEYRNLREDWTNYNDNNDITVNSFISMSNNCYKSQSSILTRSLTLDDNGREYRCFVRRDFQDKHEFAASYFIGRVTADGSVPDVKPSEPTRANVGAIVGGTIGGLIFIAVIIIIVYFVIIRPRRRKQADDEKVDGNTDKGDDPDALPTYPNDPSVLYSQPKRRGKDKTEGVTNKAMDDAEDKQAPIDTKLPADNDDRRHGRRHKDKKVSSAPPETDPAHDPAANDDYDPRYDRLDRGHRDQRHRREGDQGEKPDSRERSRHHDDDRHGDDEHRRGRRRKDVDDYDKPARYDDDYGRGRRNRGYEQDNRTRGHHSSSEDGGMDSYVNTSQYSMGDGDPTIGTAI